MNTIKKDDALKLIVECKQQVNDCDYITDDYETQLEIQDVLSDLYTSIDSLDEPVRTWITLPNNEGYMCRECCHVFKEKSNYCPHCGMLSV